MEANISELEKKIEELELRIKQNEEEYVNMAAPSRKTKKEDDDDDIGSGVKSESSKKNKLREQITFSPQQDIQAYKFIDDAIEEWGGVDNGNVMQNIMNLMKNGKINTKSMVVSVIKKMRASQVGEEVDGESLRKSFYDALEVFGTSKYKDGLEELQQFTYVPQKQGDYAVYMAGILAIEDITGQQRVDYVLSKMPAEIYSLMPDDVPRSKNGIQSKNEECEAFLEAIQKKMAKCELRMGWLKGIYDNENEKEKISSMRDGSRGRGRDFGYQRGGNGYRGRSGYDRGRGGYNRGRGFGYYPRGGNSYRGRGVSSYYEQRDNRYPERGRGSWNYPVRAGYSQRGRGRGYFENGSFTNVEGYPRDTSQSTELRRLDESVRDLFDNPMDISRIDNGKQSGNGQAPTVPGHHYD